MSGNKEVFDEDLGIGPTPTGAGLGPLGRGESLRKIARQLSHEPASIRLFLQDSGGSKDNRPSEQVALSRLEREEVSRGLAAGLSIRAIGRKLGGPPSTVCREVNRNGGRDLYRCQSADAAAYQRAKRPKPSKLVLQPELQAVVAGRLELKWSPEQISNWLPLAYPDEPEMRVSHETVYLSLFVQSRGALNKELQRCLRSGRAMCYPKAKRLPQQRGLLKDMVLISERPAEVKDRAVPGHWEGDLVFGIRPSAVGTLVERHSRYLMLFALADGYKAEQVRPALTQSITQLPGHLRRTLTWDRGREMAEHVEFTVDSGVQVYFCDPHRPWLRGSNENTNGLLRQYLGKSQDLRTLTQADLDLIADEMNGRPRKTLGWSTPAQALNRALEMSHAPASSTPDVEDSPGGVTSTP
jgi:IS30 family transposase